MLKIIGGVLVIISTSFFGYSIKKNMKDNCRFTEDLMSGLQAVKEDIRYTSDYLSNSVAKSVSLSGTANKFFEQIHNEMNSGSTAEEAFEKALVQIDNEDIKNLLIETAKQIGKTDSDGQINLLECCINKLKVLHTKQLEYYEKHSNVYTKFGVVSGVLITIMLI